MTLRSPLGRLAALVCVLAGAASPAAGQRSGRADGELVLASLVGETGVYSSLLDSLRVPVQLAVDEINAAGGVLGRPVRVVTGDDGADATVVRRSFDRLVGQDKADAIIGPASSGTVLAIATKLRSEKVVACTGSATVEELSRVRSGGFLFRTAPPDRLQGRALADVLVADGHERIAILARDDSYGDEFVRWISARVAKQRPKAVVQTYAYDPGGRRPGRAVQKAAAAEPDAVVLVDFADEAAPVVRAMIDGSLGPRDVPVYAVDAMQSATLADAIDPADATTIDGIRGLAPAIAPVNERTDFATRLAESGTEPVFSAHYYDCAVLSALAAVKARSDDPAAMRKAFAENLHGETDCTTFAACRALLDQGATIHWRGASSDFEEFGRVEPNEGVYDIWTYQQGTVVTGDPSEQVRVS
jgi:branched-chain amino acid transport system substrate-binding protein